MCRPVADATRRPKRSVKVDALFSRPARAGPNRGLGRAAELPAQGLDAFQSGCRFSREATRSVIAIEAAKADATSAQSAACKGRRCSSRLSEGI